MTDDADAADPEVGADPGGEAERTAEPAAEKPVKRTVKRPAKRTVKRSAEADSTAAEKPAAKRTAKAAATRKTAAKPAAKPAAGRPAKAAAKRPVKRAAAPVAEPVAKPVAEPVAEPVVEPETAEAPEPAAQPAAEPATKPAAEPVVQADPETSPRRSRRRLLVPLVLIAVTVLAIVVVVKLAGGGDDPTGDQAQGGGSGPDGASRTVPTPPDTAPSRGSFIESTVGSDGSISVRQWIRSSTQIRALELAVVDPQDTGTTTVSAVDVVVQGLDGSVLAKKDAVGADPVRLPLSSSVPNLYLSYRIDGGADDASQSVQGRTLATVLGMDVDFSGATGAVQHLVSGPGMVTNVACLRVSDSADTPPKACGAPTDDGDWLVTLRGIDRTDRLIAQLGMDS